MDMPDRDELKRLIRDQVEVFEEIQKEREAQRTVEQALAPGDQSVTVRSLYGGRSRLHRWVWGPWAPFLHLGMELIGTAALVAIALRVYGVL